MGTFFSEIIVALWFFPYVKDRRTLFKGAATALVIIGAFILLIAVYTIGIFGFREVERMLLPALNLVRSVRLGGVLERLDILLISAWLLAIFLRLALFAYLSASQLAWVSQFRKPYRLVFPLTALAALLSLVLANNVVQFGNFISQGGFIPFTYLHTLVLPILLLVVQLLRPGLHKKTKEGLRQ